MGRGKSQPAGNSTPLQVHTHLVSDATGTAAERIARAALIQFRKNISPVFIRHPFVKNTKELSHIVNTAEQQNGIVIYTMNNRHLREWLAAENEHRHIVMIDMLGPLFSQVSLRYRCRPELDSGLLGQAFGEQSLRLAQSIDFTLRHDDGQEIKSIGKADVILLGVSRTSKTPTSMYLSCNHNLKVANVPLALGLEPPHKLFTLKRPKMIGLTIDPGKLASIRQARFKGKVVDGYSDTQTILAELAMAEEIFARIRHITIIDVTNRPIEEVANKII